MEQNQPLSVVNWHHRYKQQAGWSGDVRRYLFGKAAISPEDKILEVGSGTGAVISLVSDETDAKCYGIDIDIRSLLFSESRYPKIQLAAADGFHLPFPNNIFSITYCHYLLLWVQDPLKILIEMARVTKSGGYLIALAEPDYEARIDYPLSLEKLGEMQTKSLVEQGMDPSMGRKLVGLFHKAGIQRVTSGILGAQWDQPATREIDETEWIMIQTDTADHLSPEALAIYRKVEVNARRKGTRVLFIPTFYAAGIAP